MKSLPLVKKPLLAVADPISFSRTHYGDEYQDYKQTPVTEITLPSNEHRNRPHGKVDGRNIKRSPTEKKFTPRPRVPDLNALRKIFPNEPWKAQMTQGKDLSNVHLSLQSFQRGYKKPTNHFLKKLTLG